MRFPVVILSHCSVSLSAFGGYISKSFSVVSCSHESLMLLNNDAVVTDAWLEQLAALATAKMEGRCRCGHSSTLGRGRVLQFSAGRICLDDPHSSPDDGPFPFDGEQVESFMN